MSSLFCSEDFSSIKSHLPALCFLFCQSSVIMLWQRATKSDKMLNVMEYLCKKRLKYLTDFQNTQEMFTDDTK